MQQVLCFGDSNTWGYDPANRGERYSPQLRWTGLLQMLLAQSSGHQWKVVEEGLNGRTTVFGAELEPHRVGLNYIAPCVLSHKPLSAIILMLGTNDIQPRLHPGPVGTAELKDGMKQMISIIRSLPECGPLKKAEPAQILLIAPPPIRKAQGRPEVWEKYGKEQGLRLSEEFAGIYGEIAREMGCGFLDAAAYAQADLSDGVHFTRDSHPRLGAAAARAILEMEETKKTHTAMELKKDIEM